MAPRLEKMINFLKRENINLYRQWFNTRNIVNDPMETIYSSDGIVLDVCHKYDYFEIFGLTDEEMEYIKNIFDI